ncbi:MAG: hypothetical protein JNL82_08815 [Myxococcales bacterium]|nr:hypothetical protein [Myxococcales bacterium]
MVHIPVVLLFLAYPSSHSSPGSRTLFPQFSVEPSVSPLEDVSAVVLLPDSPDPSLSGATEVVAVERVPVVAEPVVSVVVGVLSIGSTAGPEVELLDDASSRGVPPAPSPWEQLDSKDDRPIEMSRKRGRFM